MPPQTLPPNDQVDPAICRMKVLRRLAATSQTSIPVKSIAMLQTGALDTRSGRRHGNASDRSTVA
jgi:hypothetical protein